MVVALPYKAHCVTANPATDGTLTSTVVTPSQRFAALIYKLLRLLTWFYTGSGGTYVNQLQMSEQLNADP